MVKPLDVPALHQKLHHSSCNFSGRWQSGTLPASPLIPTTVGTYFATRREKIN